MNAAAIAQTDVADVSTSTAKPFVHLENIWKARGTNQVLKGIDFSAGKGEIHCLLGPSGAGKSTLLRCINAIELADSGLVHIDGEIVGCTRRPNGTYVRMSETQVARQRAEIGMVFQNFNLFPHRSVLQNITDQPRRVLKISRVEAEERARELLEQVGLQDKADQYPRHLSGGQQQRVAIARALAMRPKLMLFDEPTSALDPHLTHEVLDVIRDLAASGMTMIIVTHEIQFAREIADSVAVMANGVIVEQSPPSEILVRPVHPATRGFLDRAISS
jgi:ABC-type polar amino acid transport system ATPase subunit